jgi:hypothetical protein
MLYQDLISVENHIFAQKDVIRKRRAMAKLKAGHIQTLTEYDETKDTGYFESVSPLNVALKALRDEYHTMLKAI